MNNTFRKSYCHHIQCPQRHLSLHNRENNQQAGVTKTWEYDAAGNILARTEYPYTTDTLGTPTKTDVYTYGDSDWGDLLTAYDGQEITYDTIGNPLSDGTRTYTWKNGRELNTLTQGGKTWTNTYNADGLRIKRTDGTTTYRYVYTGDCLSRMSVGNDTLYFAYDANGLPLTVTHNDTTYYYVLDAQGNVTAILNAAGTAVANYSYDAWGNLTSEESAPSTIGSLNPLRYHGYVYDSETQLYYLQNRFYNPEIGRFINADNYTSTGQGMTGYNMFAYCGNNPIIREDSDGEFWLGSLFVKAVAGIVTQYVGDVVFNVVSGETGLDIFKPRSSKGEYIAAAITAVMPGSGFLGAFCRNAVTEGIVITEKAFSGQPVSVTESIAHVAMGTALDFSFELGAKKVSNLIDSKGPQNYSSYAHKVRNNHPRLSRAEVTQAMQRSVRINRFLRHTTEVGIDFIGHMTSRYLTNN